MELPTSHLRVIFLGTHHPHFYQRLGVLRQRDHVQLIGFWEEDQILAEKIEARTSLQRFKSEQDLVGQPFDIAFVHSLDHDVPRLALLAANAGAKGLLLEKPGGTQPSHVFKLIEELQQRPEIVVEFGWEMHYAEVMDFVRDITKKGALGDITTSHWHGGTPSGGSVELWQRQEDSLGGCVYCDGSHTIEAIVDVFGLPKSVSASIRKLPPKPKHPIVTCYYDMHEEQLDPATAAFAIGELRYEDIGSVILEYDDHNVVADFTAWEPTDWCEDWGINIYGTNGAFHGVLNPPKGELRLRAAKGGYSEGVTSIVPEKPEGVSNQVAYYTKQIDLFLKRVKEGVQTESSGIDIELKLMKVLQAIYTSAKERRFIDIE